MGGSWQDRQRGSLGHKDHLGCAPVISPGIEPKRSRFLFVFLSYVHRSSFLT